MSGRAEIAIRPSLRDHLARYDCTAEHHDQLFQQLTRTAHEVPELREHRDWVERNRWGYGDRALHAMWLALLEDLASREPHARALEIGVFKGQVISLWALLARRLDWSLEITALSPFAGELKPGVGALWRHRLRKLVSRRYRQQAAVGNLQPHDDYLRCNRQIFEAFDLEFDRVRTIQARSGDPEALAALADHRFELVYIDGDHTYEGALFDLRSYGPKVVPGGFLVVDDGGWFLPGETFFKGFETVSRACEAVPSLGFTNVWNVGHNRVYQRTAS